MSEHRTGDTSPQRPSRDCTVAEEVGVGGNGWTDVERHGHRGCTSSRIHVRGEQQQRVHRLTIRCCAGAGASDEQPISPCGSTFHRAGSRWPRGGKSRSGVLTGKGDAKPYEEERDVLVAVSMGATRVRVSKRVRERSLPRCRHMRFRHTTPRTRGSKIWSTGTNATWRGMCSTVSSSFSGESPHRLPLRRCLLGWCEGGRQQQRISGV